MPLSPPDPYLSLVSLSHRKISVQTDGLFCDWLRLLHQAEGASQWSTRESHSDLIRLLGQDQEPPNSTNLRSLQVEGAEKGVP